MRFLVFVFGGLGCLGLGAFGAVSRADEPPPSGSKAEEKSPPAAPKPILKAITRGPASTGAVALTFDDGPHPKLTPRLIEILKKENVAATFFLLGDQVAKNPQIVKALSEAGFEIANHSFTHARLTDLSMEDATAEIVRTQGLIEAATGKRPTLFRPPYGSTNDRINALIADHGYDQVTWSVDPRDWQSRSAEKTLERVLAGAEPGAIILMHDIHASTVEAVPAIITGIREKGLNFVTAGELVKLEKEDRIRRADLEKSDPAAASSDGGDPPPDPSRPVLVPLERSSYRKKYGAGD